MWCSECLVMLHQPPWHISQAKWRRSRGVGSENIQHGRCSFHWKGKECHSYIYCSLLQNISNYVFHYCQCSMPCILHSLKLIASWPLAKPWWERETNYKPVFRGQLLILGIVYWEVYQIVYLMLDKNQVKMTVLGFSKKAVTFLTTSLSRGSWWPWN